MTWFLDFEKFFNRFLPSLPVWILIFLPALAQSGQTAEDRGLPGGFRVSVDVDLVMLDVAVKDRQGAFVPDLSEENFTVYEDGVLQEISIFHEGEIPLTAGLVIDKSGSMRRNHKDVVEAAMAFVETRDPKDQLFVVNFNERPYFGLPGDQPFSNDPVQLRIALLRTPIEGRTALYDAVLTAMQHARRGKHSKRALIVISDGGDNVSRNGLQQVLAAARQAGMIIYAIGFQDRRSRQTNLEVLEKLARETGGTAYFPRSWRHVRRVTREIADDLRRQYQIGYMPTTPRDGTYKEIQVEVDSPHHRSLNVRSRAGYYATPPTPAGGD